MLDISCESSAWQSIHMKHQASFSSKDRSNNNKSVVCNFAWLKALKTSKFSEFISPAEVALVCLKFILGYIKFCSLAT